MDSFDASQDQNSGAGMSPQTVEQNTNIGALGQQRGQAYWPNWGGASDEPWNHLSFGTPGDGQARSQLLGAANFQTTYHDYRSKPILSECDTNPEDSTYGSRLTHSIGNLSTYGEEIDPEIQALEAQNPDAQLVNRNLETLQLQCPPTTSDPQLYQNQWARPHPPASVATAPVGGGEHRWVCNDCQKRCRTRSELRKHELKHSLPWHCNVSGCARDKGFTSKNDLDRHKRTVHGDRTVSGRTFVCNIGVCATKNKYWPRADNFRSHLQRIHAKTYSANDDLSEYIYRSAPSQDLEGIGGSAMAYLQAQEQSSSSDHPSAILSVRSPYGDRRVSQTQPGTNSLSRGSASVSFDRDASGLATVREGDENFIQPDILSGPGPLPPARWPVSVVSEEDASGDDITASESEHQPDAAPEAMDGVQQSGNSDIVTTSFDKDVSIQQPDVRMTDTDETEKTPRAVLSREDLSEALPGANPASTYKLLDKIPKELIASYLKKHSADSGDDSSKSDLTSTRSQAHPHKCPDCGKSFIRLCELKKHRKRHSKPYGCTYANCKKTFGSKNDWKRHESSQHYQLETWKCDYTKSDSNEICGKVCSRRESFRNHLVKEHLISDSHEQDEKVDSCRKGRHCDASFWCGFCLKTIDIKEKDNTWAKRCDHIDDHFSGRQGLKKHISQWVHEWNHQVDMTASHEFGSGSSSGSSTSGPKSPQRCVTQDGNDRDHRGRKEAYMWACVYFRTSLLILL
ncbi:hypothetical protein FHETE_9419 [Fusarium heterosporum]|uniref:C2H2-type domain-containing protein n=1 Tax=Fusarium heterosporum TaxID=42747 RepID=A0A8H5SXJ1_FUSHE|nr:hypothetical protein FHETE_9419 [Fusarium heterosporum]